MKGILKIIDHQYSFKGDFTGIMVTGFDCCHCNYLKKLSSGILDQSSFLE